MKKIKCFGMKEDSAFNIKNWKIYKIKDVNQVRGVNKEIWLKNKDVKKPIAVDETWLNRYSTRSKC